MTHGILQFALRIAFRCVLHRCKSQDIRCWKLFSKFHILWCNETSCFCSLDFIIVNKMWVYKNWMYSIKSEKLWDKNNESIGLGQFLHRLPHLLLLLQKTHFTVTVHKEWSILDRGCKNIYTYISPTLVWQWSFRRFTYGNLVTTFTFSR